MENTQCDKKVAVRASRATICSACADKGEIMEKEEILAKLREIADALGAANFSSHNQMRDAIESGQGLTEELIAELEQPSE